MARKRRPRSLPREQRIMLSSECHTFRVRLGDGAEMEERAQYLSKLRSASYPTIKWLLTYDVMIASGNGNTCVLTMFLYQA